MRTTSAELEATAKEQLRGALAELGLPGEVAVPAEHGVDFLVEVGGTLVGVEVTSVVGPSEAEALAARAREVGLPVLVAAQRVAKEARAILRDAGVGYHDQRGHLRLVVPGVFVDAEVAPSTRDAAPLAPLAGETAKEVALVLLEDPATRRGVREIARSINRAASSVSVALEALRSAGLATSANEPLVPDLFWELASGWRRDPVALARAPQAGAAGEADSLRLGFGRRDETGEWVLDEVGWVLTDTLGALSWGAPVAVSEGHPPDFYVPSQTALRRAIQILGRAASAEERRCTVSLAPVRYVCASRVVRPGEPWPVASHVVVALDLAQDRARGRDVLEHWRPAEVPRVW